MKNILQFLVSPSKEAKKITEKSYNKKILLILIITIFFGAAAVGKVVLGPLGKIFGIEYYIGLFIISILVVALLSVLLFLGGKLFKGKARYIDVLLLSVIVQIPYIIFNIIIGIGSSTGNMLFVVWGALLDIVPIIWAIVLLACGLSLIEGIVKWKSTIISIISYIAGIVLGIVLLSYGIAFFVFHWS